MQFQGLVDEQTINYVYQRYIDLLQVDKNATIEQILREEPLVSRLREIDSHDVANIEREIEQAVVEKLY